MSVLFNRINRRLGRIAAALIQNLWRKRFGKSYNRKTNTICRFYPSCSHYAVVAFLRHGFVGGLKLTRDRIKRCNTKNTDSCVDFPLRNARKENLIRMQQPQIKDQRLVVKQPDT